jgi:hypothetical protein
MINQFREETSKLMSELKKDLQKQLKEHKDSSIKPMNEVKYTNRI